MFHCQDMDRILEPTGQASCFFPNLVMKTSRLDENGTDRSLLAVVKLSPGTPNFGSGHDLALAGLGVLVSWRDHIVPPKKTRRSSSASLKRLSV